MVFHIFEPNALILLYSYLSETDHLERLVASHTSGQSRVCCCSSQQTNDVKRIVGVKTKIPGKMQRSKRQNGLQQFLPSFR